MIHTENLDWLWQAMFGWAAALIGEISTGRGALGQLQLETGLPPYAIDLLVSATLIMPLTSCMV